MKLGHKDFKDFKDFRVLKGKRAFKVKLEHKVFKVYRDFKEPVSKELKVHKVFRV